MPFGQELKAEVLVACARRCCICHKFCGLKIECHHIIGEAGGGLNTSENCIPLCFDCHADMRSYDLMHPRGTKFQPEELRRHRDAWFAKVASAGGVVASPDHIPVDRVVFQRFRDQYPWEPTFRWLKQQDFGGEFDNSFRDPLYALAQTADDPGDEFLDADLEGARGELVCSVQTFVHDLATVTFRSDGIADFFGVPPEWRYKDYQRWHDTTSRLNREADHIVASYESLIRSGRARLGVD
jgi:hypothetical protein